MSKFMQFIIAVMGATACAILCAAVSLVVLGWIVNMFKLNYGRDAYWVFSVSFCMLIISWIVAFGFFMSQLPSL
jgi:hypothetical protein